MSGRGGLPIKNILYAVVALFLVYMLYVYHGSQNRLYEAEMTGARYKREVEERVSEIQDLVKGHDKFQETCQKEKRELQNTITSVNTKYKMLESHQRDTEADLNTMKQHMETMKQEHSDAYTQHAQEYQALKQEKENEIARIKDELADATRRNQELAENINNLKQKLQEEEVLNTRVLECSASLNSLEKRLVNCHDDLKAAELREKTQAAAAAAAAAVPNPDGNKLNVPKDEDKLDVLKDGDKLDVLKDGDKLDVLKDGAQRVVADKLEDLKANGAPNEDPATQDDTVRVESDAETDSKLQKVSKTGGNDTQDLTNQQKIRVQTYEANLQNVRQDMLRLQSGRNQLIQENARLQQSLLEKQLRGRGENVGIPADPARVQAQVAGNNVWLPNDGLRHRAPVGNVYDMKIDSPMKDMNQDSKVYGKDVDFRQESELKRQAAADFPNAPKQLDSDLGQVLAPKLHPDGNEDDDMDKDKLNEDVVDVHKPMVNPNDEQKAQILEPFAPNKDKDDEGNNEGDDREDGILGEQDGGGEEGLDKRNAREEEEEREAGARREEEGEAGDGLAPHQNPLALRQLEVPGHLDSRRREVEADEEEMRDRGGPGAGAGVGQQLPPILDGKRMGEADKFGDNQYFGEADEEDRQMAEDDNGNNNEEEEEMEEEEAEVDNQEDDQLGEEHVNDEMAEEEEEEEEDKRMMPFN